MENRRRIALGWLLAQGAGIVAFWIALDRSPAAREAFLPDAMLDPTFAAVRYADLGIEAALSFTAAYAVHRRSRHAELVSTLLLGAMAYATLFAIGWRVEAGAPWIGPLLMIGATLGTATTLRLAR